VVTQVRPGVRLGIDVGSVRIGIARTDASATLAVPVETVRRGGGDIERIAAIVAECEAVELVIGLPLGLSGRTGPAAQAATDFAERLAAAVAPVAVRLVDERLSTVQAHRNLRTAGRSARSGRSVIDQEAAVILVQYAVDHERATGTAPGRLIQE
jgi:putative holliday junction resolvase